MKSIRFAALTALMLIPAVTPANASDWLNRIDNAVTKIENTVTRTENTVERADRTADRISSKIPEGEQASAPQEATAQPKTQAQIANDTIPSAGTATLTAEEEAILAKAKQIEEERILREAEAIRSRRSAR